MKSSDDDKVDKEEVQKLVEKFVTLIGSIFDSIDAIAKVNTVQDNEWSEKKINASQFRFVLRKLRKEIIDEMKDPTKRDRTPLP